jgi:hypothetical protein
MFFSSDDQYNHMTSIVASALATPSEVAEMVVFPSSKVERNTARHLPL